jgi:hypothetical protein
MTALLKQAWASAVLWWCLVLGLGAVFWQVAVPDLWQRACWLGEWPVEQGCEAHAFRHHPEARPEVFSAHLQEHVGDAHAWAALTQALWERQDPALDAALDVATALAPFHSTVLLARTDLALQRSDWPVAAQTLVALVERGFAPARPSLQALMQHPEGQPEVLAQVRPDTRWLDAVLAQLDAATHPATVLPFVDVGLQHGVLKPGTLLVMVDRLKQKNQWADAHTLWVTQRGQVPAGLYNGDFESRALRRGFDWEWPQQASGKAGLRVQQVSASPDPGFLLQVDLTGRGALPVPMVSQVVWLPGERYRLRARFMTDALRTREGVVWALRCAQGGERWASSEPMRDTLRRWGDVTLDFEVPEECAGAVRLQLEPQAAWEARAGMTGSLYFDQMAIEARSEDAP